MLITAKTHLARMADKDAEIAGLMARLAAGQRVQEADATRIRDLKDRCNDLWALEATAQQEVRALTERLAPFERVRGKGGRFVKAEAGQ